MNCSHRHTTGHVFTRFAPLLHTSIQNHLACRSSDCRISVLAYLYPMYTAPWCLVLYLSLHSSLTAVAFFILLRGKISGSRRKRGASGLPPQWQPEAIRAEILLPGIQYRDGCEPSVIPPPPAPSCTELQIYKGLAGPPSLSLIHRYHTTSAASFQSIAISLITRQDACHSPRFRSLGHGLGCSSTREPDSWNYCRIPSSSSCNPEWRTKPIPGYYQLHQLWWNWLPPGISGIVHLC